MKHSPKLAILQSLDAMDQVQMENVLDYIKSVLRDSDPMAHKSLKKEAMKEIRKALRQNKGSQNLQFV